MTDLLSNPDLDQLYAIRRILIGRYYSVSKIKDQFGMQYYREKIEAMDKAIASFIEVEGVPLHFQEVRFTQDGEVQEEESPAVQSFNAVRNALGMDQNNNGGTKT